MLAEMVDSMRRHASTHGGEWVGSCPWCGGTDRFHVWPAHPSGRSRYWCRGCGRRGDELDMLRQLRGLSFQEAKRCAGLPVSDTRPLPVPASGAPALRPPPAAWQAAADAVAQQAERDLWGPGGSWARDYLHGRGFTDDTLRAARLGCVRRSNSWPASAWGLPADRADVWVPRGVAIPWRLAGGLWQLKVRTDNPERRYAKPAGGNSMGLYGADGVRPGQPAVLVEGELDALAVAQEAGDLVAAVAAGSASGARHDRWRRLLASVSVLLVAFDADEAGEQGSDWWLERNARARRLVPVAHDPAYQLQAGGDLRGWVEQGLLGATRSALTRRDGMAEA